MKTSQTPKIKKLLSSNWKMLPLAALATVCGVQSASAILTFDLRAVSVSPGAGDILGPKSVSLNPGAAGAVVNIELWAVVTGADTNVNETLTSLFGSIMSSPGNPANRDTGVAGNQLLLPTPNDIRGNLLNTLELHWKVGATVKDGPIGDFDGDGDLDVGGNVNTGTTNYIVANAGGAQNGTAPAFDANNFHALTNGREFRISIATFTIQGVLSNAQSSGINWVVPSFTSGLNENARALFATDGANRTGADVNLAVAAPINLTVVPEPSAFGMVLLGAMGLVGFRRLGIRRA